MSWMTTVLAFLISIPTFASVNYDTLVARFQAYAQVPEESISIKEWMHLLDGFNYFLNTKPDDDTHFKIAAIHIKLFNRSFKVELLKAARGHLEKIITNHPESLHLEESKYLIARINEFFDKNGAFEDYLRLITSGGDKDTLSKISQRLKKLSKSVSKEKSALLKNLPSLPDPTKKTKTIIIDPGHGGLDAGAIGKSGTQEKNVTLAIAKKVRALLSKRKGFDVLLTRTTDEGISLESRRKMANEKNGDIFVSIHANSSDDPHSHGVETYVLNNTDDRAARKLASVENGGAGVPIDDLNFILTDMQVNSHAASSQQAALEIHNALVGDLKSQYTAIINRGIRQALFYVLVGVRMPSVVVEASFISNPNEEARLKNPKYQSTIAQAVAKGIVRFFKTPTDKEKIEF